MSVWDTYTDRCISHGETKRNAALLKERRFLLSKLKHSLSYHNVFIDDVAQNVAIINSDNLNEKKIYSMPGETLRHGGVVTWSENHWLITDVDANNEVYTRGIMLQCNYLLKWIDPVEKTIHEQWCVVEDGTKYLTGEFSNNDFSVVRGDSRLSLTIAKNEHTLRFNRESRFIIDDYGSPSPLAYRLSKPYKLGGTYDDTTGVLTFVLVECNTETDDNIELHIADYYTYFPTEKDSTVTQTTNDSTGRQVWI